MNRYRAAVIGCGPHTKYRGGRSAIAYAHGWAYKKEPRIEMVAACSRTEKNRADYMSGMGIKNGGSSPNLVVEDDFAS